LSPKLSALGFGKVLMFEEKGLLLLLDKLADGRLHDGGGSG
jgi:hypothetical protein